MKEDLTHSLHQLMTLDSIPYKGCVIRKKGDEYLYGGETFTSLVLAKKFIDIRFENWNKKISTNGNTGH